MNEPTLVYDDDCGFCTWWADFFDERTDLRIVGFSDLTDDLRERLPDNYEDCSHLMTDDGVYSCGASIEEALVRTDVAEPAGDVVGFLRQFRDYEQFREQSYRWVADNRDRWGQLLSKTPPARQESDED
ncbi:DCC1-like thiol-disulfide oxidoreductase family protein [Natrinema salifodinae]|uniref:Predicted thiol-disulfide oxidoreductase YuxK, DCC family n=1 Tax=Natrinema salifodinae TaxID=1202768 RepID=A0A1I0PLI3_9EURY|nr:DCC1-like thiol-disulfide oxidoreductase family protein [Natrinema salifodinae]SEW15111.1 Predicted thiol-disulfide oxidoreductase YuxK, DCC family [Natrinema salifodinae]